ncbi:JAB domain-containing protein [Anaerostipes hadrus]
MRKETTKRIRECTDFMGIDLLNHVIIAKENFVSLRELDFWE